MRVSGFVQEIKTKPTKIGDMFDLRINGDYYGHGKYAPRGVVVGDYVEFEMEQNGNFRNIGRGTLRKADAPADAQPPNTPAPTSAPQRTAVPNSFDDRQVVISKQAALNTSIEFVKLAFESGALVVPGSGKGYAVLEQAVFEQAAKFHKFSTGVDVEIPAVEGAKAPAKRAAKNTVAQPADDEWQDDPLPDNM